MSSKLLVRLGIAVVIVAVLLIFLGVNFVPRIFASSSSSGDIAASAKLVRPNYINELYPRSIASQLSTTRSDWIERHPSVYYSNSDWVERHPSSFYTNSDWVQRHPAQ